MNESALAQIEWDKLYHAYGTAENIPERLRALAGFATREQVEDGADKAQLDSIKGGFYSDVFHQGTVYAVTSKVIPFLVDIFCSEQTVNKDIRAFIVVFLHHCARGFPYQLFPQRVDVDALFANATKAEETLGANNRDALRRGDLEALEGVEGDGVMRAFAVYAQDSYIAVETSLDRMLQWFTTAEDNLPVLAHIISLCASFPNHQATIVPFLRHICEKQDGVVGAIALVAIVQLGQEVQMPSWKGRLALFKANACDETSLYGAVAEVLFMSRNADISGHSEILDSALQIILQSKWRASTFACPFCGSLRALILRILIHAFPDGGASFQVVEYLGDELSSTVGMGQVDAVKAMCTVARMKHRDPSMSKLQARVEELLAQHVTWGNTIYANVSSIFREHGLPYSKQKLLEMIGQPV